MSFSKELMKGTAELIVLQALKDHGESYGYQLIQMIAKRNNDLFAMREGTLYPLLYRLEDRGYVSSQEREAPSGKMRRYYSITKKGMKLLEERSKEMAAFFVGVKQALHLVV